ncbi:septum formation initiator family protein [Micromonospora sp. WMMD987]|uniref:septum formation initiator family protein n=1 Tax=Micromonospora sp. WMMD987 TaxID=3016089 RepID=UPI00249C0EAD|nr:septum formation initiator family protein [Micromonospora sp. WMMD987]WFE96376.1 septum formation initiator family protein [Micromonospora sp. WMMD987]
MQQRRTPGGQRPARRPTGRPGAGRTSLRDGGVRAEARATTARSRGTDGVRSANRPAAARRTAAGGTIRRLTAPHPRRFTGRATVLFAVLLALALAYTYPVRVYLDQQVDIERMEASQAAQREQIAELSAQAAKWQDPEYIKIKARERFYMVAPGETPVIVLNDADGAALDANGGRPQAPPKTPDPWYDTLWSSVRAANGDTSDQ